MAMDDQNKCPICGGSAIVGTRNPVDVKCSRCGSFKITNTAVTVISSKRSNPKMKGLFTSLSAYTRQASERGEEIILDSQNWEGFARANQGTPYSQKVIKLLEVLAARSVAPGHPVRFDGKSDFVLIDAADVSEFAHWLEHLKDLGWARQSSESWVYYLTGKGWEKLESMGRAGGAPGKCFVAMSFDPSLKDAYDNGIYLAVKEDCKMDPVRMDLVPHNENIIFKIIAEIRSSQFVIADFTGQNRGVYFEAGFAMGLGRPVIWTCRKDDFGNTHFDIKQFNHVLWEAPVDLREKLADRIKATIST